MEYLGVLAFVIVLCYMSYPDKVKKLERKVKKLEKERCRESIMSKLIDEEWLKISLKDKKNQEIVKMIRVEDVDEIEVKVDQSL